MQPLPIQNCYWVIPGKFLAGEYPRNPDEDSSLEKIGRLILAGVNTFIDLTEEDEGLLPYQPLLQQVGADGLTHQRFAIRDVSVPDSPDDTRAILDAIDLHLSQGKLVYLHCYGGIGRTGTIVGCWLSRHGHPGEAALHQLHHLWQQCPKSAWRKSPETHQQEQYILHWEE